MRPTESPLLTAPLDDLLAVLLRQLRRPLQTHGFSFTDGEAQTIALARSAPPALISALAAVIQESEAVLGKLNLTFAQSLTTGMDALGGWESTAEFLELANDKSNAELRISLAAAIGYACSQDVQFVPHLQTLAAGDFDEESIIARRILAP